VDRRPRHRTLVRERLHKIGLGRVWTLTVTDARLLACIDDQRPGESEYVVNVLRLPIRLAEESSSEP